MYARRMKKSLRLGLKKEGGGKAAAHSPTSQKFIHKKSLGQNFLTSDFIPKKMCDAAALRVGETVLEIGPGTGALTKELLVRGVTVIAIEADSRAVTSLQETFAEEISKGRFVLHHLDARTLDLKSLGLADGSFKVVANIPYYLSGFLFRTILESPIQPSTLVFLIQKEVAERIARDKKESLLSISIKVFGEPKYITTVKRGHFNPPPKVDSAIIAVRNISRTAFETLSIQAFFELLHLGFGQKRKQLIHNLSHSFEREQISLALQALALPQTVRAEDLSAKQWVTLATHLL